MEASSSLQSRFSQNYERLRKGEFLSNNERLEEGMSKIFRVLDHIRETDPRSYEPKVVSIGPYHVNNPRLRKMDEIKLFYLKRFLDRNPRVGLEDYEKIIKELKATSKYWYSEDVEMDEDLFSRMLLVDGCFILELLLGNLDPPGLWEEDPISGNTLMLSLVEFDILLFDNQMPLVILERLYDLQENDHTLVYIFVKSFRGLVKDLEPLSELPVDISNFHHLLHLFHACFIVPPIIQMPIPRVDATESTLMTPCATDLKGVGVEFRLIENKIFTWNLSPEMDVIEISLARLNSNSNSFYRNLIIFEQYFFKVVRSKVMTYAMFMSCLIGSEADLTLLREKRIVMYTLNQKEATTFFRKICTDSIIDYDKSFLSYLRDKSADIWKIYDTPWNRSIAYLKGNPYGMAYLIGSAIFVVVLTVLQTVYTVLAYYQDRKVDPFAIK